MPAHHHSLGWHGAAKLSKQPAEEDVRIPDTDPISPRPRERLGVSPLASRPVVNMELTRAAMARTLIGAAQWCGVMLGTREVDVANNLSAQKWPINA